MRDKEEFESAVQLTAQLLKATLGEMGLYLGVLIKEQQFIFIDRETYHSECKTRTGKINMKEINVIKREKGL